MSISRERTLDFRARKAHFLNITMSSTKQMLNTNWRGFAAAGTYAFACTLVERQGTKPEFHPAILDSPPPGSNE